MSFGYQAGRPGGIDASGKQLARTPRLPNWSHWVQGELFYMLLADLDAEVFGFSNGAPTVPSLFESARVDESLTRSIGGDTRSLEAVESAVRQTRPDIVMHMAAQPLVRESYRDPIDTYATNVLGIANVLEAARRVSGIDIVMVVTSDKCYYPYASDGPYVESDRLGGPDPYSASKACAELVVHSRRLSSTRAAPGCSREGPET